MTITHTTAIRNALATVVGDAVDSGSIDATGRMIFRTEGGDEVATLALANPAFGDPSNGTITANAISDDTNAAGGTVTNFRLVDRNGDMVVSGTVTAVGGGGDIELSSTTIGAGDTVSVSSLTYTASE